MADKPSVLFVCVHNAGRSPMAAGFLTAMAGTGSRCAPPAPPPPTASTRSSSRRCTRWGSTSQPRPPRSSPPRPSRPATWSSRCAAATRARTSPAPPISTGRWRIRPGQGIDAIRPIRDDIRPRVEALVQELTGQPV